MDTMCELCEENDKESRATRRLIAEKGTPCVEKLLCEPCHYKEKARFIKDGWKVESEVLS